MIRTLVCESFFFIPRVGTQVAAVGDVLEGGFRTYLGPVATENGAFCAQHCDAICLATGCDVVDSDLVVPGSDCQMVGSRRPRDGRNGVFGVGSQCGIRRRCGLGGTAEAVDGHDDERFLVQCGKDYEE